MTVDSASQVYYDPYDIELNADPYPMYRRMREETPLYYNPKYDFYALSRFDDVNQGLVDHQTFSSGRGAILEWIKGGLEVPSGILSFEDPPIHNIHRKLLARMFPAQHQFVGGEDPPILFAEPGSSCRHRTI